MAVAYVVVGGGIMQLALAVFPAWELPNWTLRLTIVRLLIGFPLALLRQIPRETRGGKAHELEEVDLLEGIAREGKALAEVYAPTGENAQAIARLAELLSRPSDVTVAALKLDPAIRRLRDDPEFQTLLAKHEAIAKGRALNGPSPNDSPAWSGPLRLRRK